MQIKVEKRKMSGNTSVSFITPSYNQGKYIGRTICSVLEQNIANFDYVVMDGGSKDETLDILRQYENHLTWVSELDQGQAHAVNKGIATTTGDIVAWINSDDVYYSGALKRVVEYFDLHPDVDVLYGDAYHIDKDDEPIARYNTEPWNKDRLKETCFLCQPAVFFRRRVVERYGVLDETLNFCMDYEYWLRLAGAGAVFEYMPIALAGSRMYPENKTLSNRVATHEEAIEMLARKFDKIPAVWLYRYVHLDVLERRGWDATNDTLYQWQLIWHLFLAFLRWRKRLSTDFFMMSLQKVKSRLLGGRAASTLDESIRPGFQ
jgi:glycosyltransferase involved in cell wall biosynthesis